MLKHCRAQASSVQCSENMCPYLSFHGKVMKQELSESSGCWIQVPAEQSWERLLLPCVWDLTPGINLFLLWQLCGRDSVRTHKAPLAMHKVSQALHQCQDVTSECGQKNSVLPNMVWSPVLVSRDGHPHLMTSNNKRPSPALTDMDTLSCKVRPPLGLVISLSLRSHLWLACTITWEL